MMAVSGLEGCEVAEGARSRAAGSGAGCREDEKVRAAFIWGARGETTSGVWRREQKLGSVRRRHGCGPEPQDGLDSLDGALNSERPCYSQRCPGVEQPSKQLNHAIQDGTNGNGRGGYTVPLSVARGETVTTRDLTRTRRSQIQTCARVARCPLPVALAVAHLHMAGAGTDAGPRKKARRFRLGAAEAEKAGRAGVNRILPGRFAKGPMVGC